MKSTSSRASEADPNRTPQPRGFPGLPPGWTSSWELFRVGDGKTDPAPRPGDQTPGTQLFGVLHCAPEARTGRALIALHGLGEHGGRYLHFTHYLQQDVDAVFVYDHRGHGRSEGLRGHIERFDQFAEDAAAAFRHAEKRLREELGAGVEIHLLGHSLGAHIALRLLFLHPELPIASATLSAPFLGTKDKVPLGKKLASAALSRIWGSMQLHTELDPNLICRDPLVVEAYKNDRLVHDKITPQLWEDMCHVFKDTLKGKGGIDVPLLFLVPEKDGIVDKKLTLKFVDQLDIREKKLKTYPEFYHEPFNEIGKEEPFADLAAWIREHSGSKVPKAAHKEKRR